MGELRAASDVFGEQKKRESQKEKNGTQENKKRNSR